MNTYSAVRPSGNHCGIYCLYFIEKLLYNITRTASAITQGGNPSEKAIEFPNVSQSSTGVKTE